MARYNEILSGRFNRALTKVFSIKGSAPAPQLSTEIMPVLPLPRWVDDEFLYGWDQFGFGLAVGAVAASNSSAWLTNPPNSGVIALITDVHWNVANATVNHFINANPGTLSAGFTGNPLDGRTVRKSAIQGSSGQPGALPATGLIGSFAGGAGGLEFYAIQRESQYIPLPPGFGFQTGVVAQNLAYTISFRWKERPIEDSEKGA